MASIKGAYLKKIRYDAKSPKRIDKYIEREEWTKKEWEKWIEDKLQKTLHNAKNNVPFYQKYWDQTNEDFEVKDHKFSTNGMIFNDNISKENMDNKKNPKIQYKFYILKTIF